MSCGLQCKTNVLVDPHLVASTSVLTSGFVRSLISTPINLVERADTSPSIQTQEKGPDTRPSSKPLSMTFCKASSLNKTVL